MKRPEGPKDTVITPEDAPHILKALRWKEDMHVVNDFGEHVYLRPCILNGVRVGITDCCVFDDPCPRHKRMQRESKATA